MKFLKNNRRVGLETLEPRYLLAAAPIISEFMASNAQTIKDDDGETSDWIEIHNPSDETIALAGWSLTDDSTAPNKWTFPEIDLEAGGYLLVFASGKDRTDTNADLHTNFKLRAEGEFLGLADAEGVIVQDFGESYLPQITDLAFGLQTDQALLHDLRTDGKYLVPTADDVALVDQWNQLEFDDGGWNDAKGVLGFDQRLIVDNAGFETGDLTNWLALGGANIVGESIRVTPTQGEFQVRIDNYIREQPRSGLERFLGVERFSLNELIESADAGRGAAIKREFEVQVGDVLEFDWSFLTSEPDLVGSQDTAFLTVSPGPDAIKLADVFSETEFCECDLLRQTPYARYQYTFTEAGLVTVGFGLINDGAVGFASSLLVDNITLNDGGEPTDSFANTVTTDLSAEMLNQNSSVWIRYPFEVTESDPTHGLVLRGRFEDGFTAWLNGQPVAASNSEEAPSWNSASTVDRDRVTSTSLEPFFLQGSQGLLRNGTNVLAIQGMNDSIDNAASFFEFELIGTAVPSENSAYLISPTPGRPNISDDLNVVQDVTFSESRGIFDSAFGLSLTTSTMDATIRYTTDGSLPTAANGLIYAGPISIDGTTIIRAVGMKDGYDSSEPVTRSFLFLSDTISQSDADALALGFPDTWGEFEPPRWPVKEADYELDRDVVGPNDLFGGKYARRIEDALTAIPTLSLVMDVDDIFGETGFHQDPRNRGPEWERPTSVELINPDGTPGFQINAGIRIQGGVSRFISQKQSFRILFKEEYGESKLNYPLFGSDGAEVFDSLILRSSTGEYVMDEIPGDKTIHYIRDEALRRSQLATGNLAARGEFMHLYINGLYWGVFNPVERVDGQFMSNYFGGAKEDYDVLNAGDSGDNEPFITPLQGDLEAFYLLLSIVDEINAATTQEEKTPIYNRMLGLNPDGTRNPDFPVLLDRDNYIDYLITQVYHKNSDWPVRNYILARDRGGDSAGFQFFVWDGEFTLDAPSLDGTDRGRFRNLTEAGIGVIYDRMRTSEAFLTDISDRISIHFAPGGAFYTDPENTAWDPAHPERNMPAARYAGIVEEIGTAMIGESARWGDQQVISWPRGLALNQPQWTPDERWQPSIEDNLNRIFPRRATDFLRSATTDQHYREAPEVTVNDLDPNQAMVTLKANHPGILYYTLDGSDPKLADLTVSPNAIQYSGEFSISERATLSVRSLGRDRWSSITTSELLSVAVPGDASSLRLTEINYHPHDALVDLGEPALDSELFEFVEITNVGQQTVDLNGVQLVQLADKGVSFQFGQQHLVPGQQVVVPRNVEAFEGRYGEGINLAVNAAGDRSSYIGGLGNSGDFLRMLDAQGRIVQELTYEDSGDWPGRADGNASTLELIDPQGDLNSPANYRNSSEFGGSPGAKGLGADNRVVVNELLSNSDSPQVDQIELLNQSLTSLNLGGWYLSDSNDNYLKFTIPANSQIESGGYLVFSEDDLNFGLNSTRGDDVYLIEADANGRPVRFVDHVQFDAMEAGVSLGRWRNGSGRLFPMSENTFGRLNSGPRIGDVVVSEIQYDPGDPDGAGALTASSLEYVELFNRSDATIDLSHWQLRGNSDFEFAEGTTLEAGAHIVVVPFDPSAEPITRTLFNLQYQVGANVTLIGPWSDSLDDLKGVVRLLRPETPSADEPDVVPYVLIDEVEYDSIGLWPEAIGGSNRSINRIALDGFGNDGRNWRAAAETPGRAAQVVTLPGDFDGNRVVDADDVDALCSARRSGSDIAFDLTGDGQLDLQDFEFLVREILGSRAGDANLDGQFDSSDLILVFVAAEYQDAVAGNSGWASGDWNCDGDFTSTDLVDAFVENDYQAHSAVQGDPDLTQVAATRLENTPRLSEGSQTRKEPDQLDERAHRAAVLELPAQSPNARKLVIRENGIRKTESTSDENDRKAGDR